ncbi:MAG: hypothetical protein QM711_14425 [Micropruina sp.]|uniref:hypothetical protein n=1 Tax=Micropruina sp. TaxID=2737536 RepID=UPI0039E3A3B4
MRSSQDKPFEIAVTVVNHASYRFRFVDVTEIQIDGSVHLGETNQRWVVLGTAMLEADCQRADGRLAYVIELADALICFASRLASLTAETD